jgi:tetratricopeptide (TPR) repeat protein
MTRVSVVLVVSLAVVVLGPAASAQAPPVADVYRGVLAVYVAQADIDRAVTALNKWTAKDFETATDAIVVRGIQSEIEAAAVLQLEFGLATMGVFAPAAQRHFEIGSSVVKALADRLRKAGVAASEVAKFASTWHAVAGSAFLSLNDGYRARPFLQEAVRFDRRSAPAQTLMGAGAELDATFNLPAFHGGAGRGPDVRRRLLAIMETYQAAIEYDANYAPAHLRLARVQMFLGDLVLARSAIEHARALATNVEHKYLAALTLGAIVQRQGDLDAARAAYEQAMKLVPNSQAATVALGYLDILAGRPDRARALAQAFMTDPQDDPYWWEAKNGGVYRDGLVWLRERVRR